jgi:hypothetical protein
MVQGIPDRHWYRTLPRPAFALVARTILNKECMLVPLVPRLVTSFRLRIWLADSNMEYDDMWDLLARPMD